MWNSVTDRTEQGRTIFYKNEVALLVHCSHKIWELVLDTSGEELPGNQISLHQRSRIRSKVLQTSLGVCFCRFFRDDPKKYPGRFQNLQVASELETCDDRILRRLVVLFLRTSTNKCRQTNSSDSPFNPCPDIKILQKSWPRSNSEPRNRNQWDPTLKSQHWLGQDQISFTLIPIDIS